MGIMRNNYGAQRNTYSGSRPDSSGSPKASVETEKQRLDRARRRQEAEFGAKLLEFMGPPNSFSFEKSLDETEKFFKNRPDS